jgi:hypothetical protein
MAEQFPQPGREGLLQLGGRQRPFVHVNGIVHGCVNMIDFVNTRKLNFSFPAPGW